MSPPTAASGSGSIAVALTAETEASSLRVAHALRGAGHEVVLAALGPFEGRIPDGLGVVSVPEPEVVVTPAYLRRSYAFSRALSDVPVNAIVFPSRGGLAYCTARARQTGAAFEATTIVVECGELALHGVEGDPAPFLSKWRLGGAVTERIALELADAYVCEREELRDWLQTRHWRLPGLRLATPDGRTPWQVGADARPAVAGPDQPPLVSVIVAFHERTSFVRLCLEGLARQTHANLEVIVADDGSRSPEAIALLNGLEHETWPWPLRVLTLPHGGLGAVRNGGWREARSDLVLFIDDDDVPFDDLVAGLVRARARAGADVAVAGARFFRGDGGPSEHPGDVVRISLCEPRELGLISNQFGGPVSLWPRELLEQLGGFAPVATEDWDLLARATYAGARLTTQPEPLYWYRQTPGSMYSSDPYASRDAGIVARTERIAETLPEEWRLLPRLAAGAYSELERRRRESKPRWRAAVERGRLLTTRARQLAGNEGISRVGREAARLVRRRYDRRR